MSPQEGRVVAALVSAGLSGTIAVVGAALARIDLFRQFRFDSEAATLALTLASGVMVLELLLLLPRYDILLAGQGQEGREGTRQGSSSGSGETSSSGGGGGGGSSSSGRRRGGAVGLSLRTRDVGQLLSADSVAAALVLHQACFVAAQVVRKGTGLPLFGEAGLVMARETAKELLQRGLIFTFIAAWLTDRAFEAGADDTLMILGGEVYLTDAVRYATGCLITALLVPPILNEAEALRLGVASNLALVSVEQRQRAERQDMEARGERPDEEADKLLREYRLVEALSSAAATGPPRLAYAVTLLRGLLRFGAVNAAFALTGDLSASLAASAVPNLLLMAYVRAGPMVLLERPGQEGQGEGADAEGTARPVGEEAAGGADKGGKGRDG